LIEKAAANDPHDESEAIRKFGGNPDKASFYPVREKATEVSYNQKEWK
jgi:hypothetical protein